jgi:hypothetical protein
MQEIILKLLYKLIVINIWHIIICLLWKVVNFKVGLQIIIIIMMMVVNQIFYIMKINKLKIKKKMY